MFILDKMKIIVKVTLRESFALNRHSDLVLPFFEGGFHLSDFTDG